VRPSQRVSTRSDSQALSCDVGCDITPCEDGDLLRSTVVDGGLCVSCKSLRRVIFVVIGRLRYISVITTTNQEVAGAVACRDRSANRQASWCGLPSSGAGGLPDENRANGCLPSASLRTGGQDGLSLEPAPPESLSRRNWHLKGDLREKAVERN
jgi:hypothetical protein